MSTIIAKILLCTIYALVSFHHHPFPHYLQKYSMAMFLFIVTWANLFFLVWPWRPDARVAEGGVLAETAKYPSMLARSARLQIFATKNTVFYNCKFLQHKRRFFALALKALC